jgi:hypothetical protein
MKSLTVLIIIIIAASSVLHSSRAQAQPCAAVDTVALGLRSVAQLYLSDSLNQELRTAQGIPQIDTSAVAFVTDSTTCASAFAAWTAGAPAVPLSAHPAIHLVSFGSFYMARILPDGPRTRIRMRSTSSTTVR